MHIVEATPISATPAFLLDDIYTPALSKSHASPVPTHQSVADQHQKAIIELHRFLESSCDCV